MKPSKTRVPRSKQSPRRRGVARSRVCAPVEAVAEVRGNRALSADRYLLDLRVDMPPARPGQFVMLGLPGDTAPLLRRPFSVLGQDSSRKSLEILYSVEGSGTRVLSVLARGRELSLLGPLGTHFPAAGVADGPRAAAVGGGTATLHVLVAGGRGVAPLAFHAGSISSSRAHSSNRVLFLAGARTAAELVLLDRLEATEVFVSTDDGSQGRKGTVIQLLKSLERQIGFVRQDKGGAVGARPQALLYGCGPAGMLSALHSYAASKGLPCFVSLEARMACGLGLCQGCAVRLTGSRCALVCKDGPVFESGAVDWARYDGA